MIVVMPDGNVTSSFNINYSVPQDEFPKDLTGSIIPHVEKNYRVAPGARHGALAGLSLRMSLIPTAPAPGKRRILVVANQALSGEELRRRLGEIGERVELDVFAAVLTSYLTTPCRTSTKSSPRRAGGLTSRWHGPARAASSHAEKLAIRIQTPRSRTSCWTSVPTRVIVVTHPRERPTWQEQGELERLRRELPVLVEHVIVSAGGADNSAFPETLAAPASSSSAASRRLLFDRYVHLRTPPPAREATEAGSALSTQAPALSYLAAAGETEPSGID
jgi:hypothetical protein